MRTFKIRDRQIGDGHPCYIIAEVSCNHEGDFDEARKIIEAAAVAGADAVKLQTYTADTDEDISPVYGQGAVQGGGR